MPPLAAEPASFRDPDGSVFYADGRVLRGLSARGAHDWRALRDSGFFPKLVDAGLVVATREHDGGAPPSPRGVPWTLVLEHERIPVVTYPFEWPFAMLADAATCHLDVLLAALDDEWSTKDGTAYNVQFRGTRPVFVDVGSFEPATGPWPGYGQFCRTALFPLLAQAHLGVPAGLLLRGRLDGPTPEEVAGLFRGRRRFRRGVFRNVVLHAYAQRKVRASSEDVKDRLRRAGFGVELAKAASRKLRKLVGRLEVKRRGTAWTDYRTTCSYSDDDTAAKRALVTRVCAAHAGGTVLDLGANDGEFSLLAAEHAAYVVAVDGDEAVIDGLYRRLRADGRTDVLPLVVDLTDPSPGLGWRNRERAPFAERVAPDLVLALALVHHLAIAANLPLPEVVGFLRDFGAPVVVEFVHRDDPMVERLLANKPAGLHDDYRLDTFAGAFADAFELDERVELPGGTRTLFVGRPG